MQYAERTILALTILALVGLSLWLQWDVLSQSNAAKADNDLAGPDYYIEGVRINGREQDGIRFLLTADRQERRTEHGPAILENPQLTQFNTQYGNRHTVAKRGEIAPDGSELILIGDVRVSQEKGHKRPANVTDAERFTIRLAPRDKS
ncbi:MAG: LPS export ABC transporter periplasmic protein LptC [Pseudomonadota bacterium]|nr:LPS export ABC transporter periplasmic protein LptC [Pseudomonadota bacterium]